MTAAAGAAGGWDELAATIGRLREQLRSDLGAQTRRHDHHTRRGPWAPWGGPPPGVGPGGWSPPWMRGGAPPRTRAPKGNVRTAILALLAEGPRHGYQLMQDIAERSHDQWRPSPGSVYPVLSALADEGLVDDEKIEGRRVFALTEAGRAYVADRAAELAEVFEAYEPETAEDADVRKLLMGVTSAAVQVMTSEDPALVERGRTILAQARRDLYAVLAEDAS